MDDVENHTLRLLREIRAALEGMNQTMGRNYDDLRERIDTLRKASFGKSVLGRYAAADVDERLEALEGRVAAH